MVGLLILLFIVVPIIELAVIVQVAASIGVLPTVMLVIVVSVGGAWLMKQQGLSVWRRAQAQLQAGELPAAELVNGLLVLFAGALMLTPGFVTDLLGIVLLFPPTRAVVRAVLLRRFERRIRAAFVLPGGGAIFDGAGGSGSVGRRVFTGPASMGDVYDVREVDPDEPTRPRPTGSSRPSRPSTSGPSSDARGGSASRPELGRY